MPALLIFLKALPAIRLLPKKWNWPSTRR